MKSMAQKSSEFPSFQSPSPISSSDDSDIVTIKKVSSSVKASIGRRNLFTRIPSDVPRLRRSAILRCFGEFVASTPMSASKLDHGNEECFISPITPSETEGIIKPVSKRKCRSSLRNAVKAFNAEIKQENKLRSTQENASAQVNQEISQSKIQEILQVDACTTEKLQTGLFKKPTGSFEAESYISKYATRQTQTSDSLNTLHRKSNQSDPTNEVDSLSSLKSGVVNSVSVAENSLDRTKEVINNLDSEKEGVVNISIISISDISELQTNDLNRLEENPANESMIFAELPTDEDNSEVSSVASKTVTDNNNEVVVSSVNELLIFSHLNLETELKDINVVDRKVKEQVSKSGRIAMQITPLRERLRSRNNNVNQSNRSTNLPLLISNKRKCKEVAGNKAKRQSPEVVPSTSKIDTKELLSERKELAVQKTDNRKKNNNRKTTRVTKTALKKSECSEADALPESLSNKESSHDQHTELLMSQLSQMQKFSPCVILEKLQTHPSHRVQTRSQTKTKLKVNCLPPESSADATNESTLPQSRDPKKVTVDLYQYVVHRMSGFYLLPDEPITAARCEGRPQRTRRPPKQFIQAAFIPELPAVRRTTKFKPEKVDVKDKVRKGKNTRAQTPTSFSYNLRNRTIESGTSLVLSQSNESKKNKAKKENNSRTVNVNRIDSCMDEVEPAAHKLAPKKKVGKRLEYGNELEESVGNVNLLFDQSQICISDNTITGVRRINENENNREETTEEDYHLQCLINDKLVDVKCYSKMPLSEGNDGNPITVVSSIVNQSQNNEFTLGHMKILPNKKLFVEVNKYLFTSYTVIKGKGLGTIVNRHFPLHEGSLMYVPLGLSYSIYNNSSSPLMLQYTFNCKL